jgi:phage terminase Nu1 subunit (DNA packaging protein)
MVTAAKTRLLGVPSKAKARIPTLTVRDIEALEDLIAEALEELSLGR